MGFLLWILYGFLAGACASWLLGSSHEWYWNIIIGIIGMIVVYLVAPIMDSILSRISTKIIVPVVTALFIVFMVDVVYSQSHPNTGAGITDYDEYEQSSMIQQTQHQLYLGEDTGQGALNE